MKGRYALRVRLTYVGHATVVIDMSGTRLITDPILRPRVAHLRRGDAVDTALAADVDGVLISHAHMDHLDPASIALLEGEPTIVVPRGAARFVRSRPGIVEAGEGDALEIGALTIRATHADHDGRRYRFGPAAPTLGYRVEGDRTVYFAGDTGFFPDMAEIGRAGVDVALLPVAGWGARLPPGHLDPLAAARALELARAAGGGADPLGDAGPGRRRPEGARPQRVACTRVRRARCCARSRGGRRHHPARRDGRALG